MTIIFSLVGAVALLIAGGELLVRGAVQIAARLGVSPPVIGLTLVGFGISTLSSCAISMPRWRRRSAG